MVISFSKHARARQKERRISSELVRKIVSNPDKIKHIENDKFICYGKDNNRTLVIVFIKRREFVNIITIYYENNL